MSTVEELLNNALEAKNRENLQETQRKVNNIVNNILSWESKANELNNKITEAKKELENLELPKNVEVKLCK